MSKNKSNVSKKEVSDEILRPKNTAVAIRNALGVQESNFEAPEQKWEDLEDLYQSSATAIYQVGNQVNTALLVPGVKENIQNKEELNIAVNGLTRDLELFTDKIVKIHKKHEGRTGVIKETADMINSLSIFEDYVAFNTHFKSVTLPTVLTIMDMIGEACNEISKQIETRPVELTDSCQDVVTDNLTTSE